MKKKQDEGIEVVLPAAQTKPSEYIREFKTKLGLNVKIRKAYGKDSIAMSRLMKGDTALMTAAMMSVICEFNGQKMTMEATQDEMDMRDFNEIASELYRLGFLG